MKRFFFLMPTLLCFLAGCAGSSVPDNQTNLQSGLHKGDDIIPWNPIHVAGPNAGTNACPICTYEGRPAVIIFTKDSSRVAVFADRLQSLVSRDQTKQLKGFIVVVDATPERMKDWAEKLKITQIGLCYPDPQTRDSDLRAYKINAAADSTIMVYKNYKFAANFVNLDAMDFDRVETAVANLR